MRREIVVKDPNETSGDKNFSIWKFKIYWWDLQHFKASEENNEGKINTFPDKQKQSIFTASRHLLQAMLKEILQAERKCQREMWIYIKSWRTPETVRG